MPPGLTPPLPAAAPGRKFTDHGGKLRKLSNRLFAESAAPMQDAGDLAGRAEGDRGEGPPPWPSPQGQAAACALLEPFASGMRLLGLMQCPEAVEALQQLPAALYMSSWVLGCVGRALLEHGDHAGAAEVFREMRRVDPACDEGLVHFSTALWYLGHAAELSALAHEAVQLDRRGRGVLRQALGWQMRVRQTLPPPRDRRHSAQAWCAAGNCVSLQRDHRKALRYFRKALEVDRHNAYAHTLCGHELLAMEELEAALASYRAALVLQPRHYNAWYGMGQVRGALGGCLGLSGRATPAHALAHAGVPSVGLHAAGEARDGGVPLPTRHTGPPALERPQVPLRRRHGQGLPPPAGPVVDPGRHPPGPQEPSCEVRRARGSVGAAAGFCARQTRQGA